MRMYVAANTRHYIAYAVHQMARFSHNPKNSHAVAIKGVLRYIKKTQDKGICAQMGFKWSCNVDSDFEDFLGLKILEILCQSNKELGISFSLGMFLSYGYQNFELKLLFLQWKQNILFYPKEFTPR